MCFEHESGMTLLHIHCYTQYYTCALSAVRCVFMDDAQHIYNYHRNHCHREKCHTASHQSIHNQIDFTNGVRICWHVIPIPILPYALSFLLASVADFFVVFRKLFLYRLSVRYPFGSENVWLWTSFPICTQTWTKFLSNAMFVFTIAFVIKIYWYYTLGFFNTLCDSLCPTFCSAALWTSCSMRMYTKWPK